MAQQQPREWDLDMHDFESIDDFRAAAAQMLAEMEVIGNWLGGGFIVGTKRYPTSTGGYETREWVIRHVSLPSAPPSPDGEPQVADLEDAVEEEAEEPSVLEPAA